MLLKSLFYVSEDIAKLNGDINNTDHSDQIKLGASF